MITPEQVQQAAALVQAAVSDTARLRAWLASQPEDARWDVLAPCGCPLWHFLHPVVAPLGITAVVTWDELYLDESGGADAPTLKVLGYGYSTIYTDLQQAWDDRGESRDKHTECWLVRHRAQAVLDRLLAEGVA